MSATLCVLAWTPGPIVCEADFHAETLRRKAELICLLELTNYKPARFSWKRTGNAKLLVRIYDLNFIIHTI